MGCPIKEEKNYILYRYLIANRPSLPIDPRRIERQQQSAPPSGPIVPFSSPKAPASIVCPRPFSGACPATIRIARRSIIIVALQQEYPVVHHRHGVDLHLASDRTSCTKATANQFRLLIHTAAYWLMHTLRGLAPNASFWRDAQFDTLRLSLIKVAVRITELVTKIKISLPTGFPYQLGFSTLAARLAKLPP